MIISYKYTLEAEAKHELAAKIAAIKGEDYYSTKSSMTYSHKALLSYGMVEVISPDIGERCGSLTQENKCSLQHHKPKFCRSYWCHGKLWKPKELANAATKTLDR